MNDVSDQNTGGRPLERYLHDHLGRTKTALVLAQGSLENNRGLSSVGDLEQIVARVQTDLGELRTVLSALAYLEHAPLEEGLVWLTDKVVRHVIPRGRRSGTTPEQRVLAFEKLSLAIASMVHLWETLERLKACESSLTRFDFSRLAQSARDSERVARQLHEQAITEWISSLDRRRRSETESIPCAPRTDERL